MQYITVYMFLPPEAGGRAMLLKRGNTSYSQGCCSRGVPNTIDRMRTYQMYKSHQKYEHHKNTSLQHLTTMPIFTQSDGLSQPIPAKTKSCKIWGIWATESRCSGGQRFILKKKTKGFQTLKRLKTHILIDQ